jgi:hypothetical protein
MVQRGGSGADAPTEVQIAAAIALDKPDFARV